MFFFVIAFQAAISIPPPLCRGRVVSAYDPRLDRTPTSRAVAEVQTAYDSLCPKRNCGSGRLFENATIGNNAVTWVSGLRDGAATQAKIVYSAPFLNGLDKSYGAGASFGVLAHEVGHHLTAALSMRQLFETSWNEELRADYLAGCALGRAGRSSHELENALRALSSYSSPTHPSFEQRVPVVRRGYDECRGDAPKLEGARRPFGLGALIESSEEKGCRYRYRLTADVERVGPIVAKRRRSRLFDEESACDRERERMTASKVRVTEECICE